MRKPRKEITIAIVVGLLWITFNPLVMDAAKKAYKTFSGPIQIIEFALVSNADAEEKEVSTATNNENYPNPFPSEPWSQYFDRGIYKYDSNFPREKWTFDKSFEELEKDLSKVFDEKNVLFDIIGRHIKPLYDSGQIIKVAFGHDNKEEIGVSFRYDGKVFAGFRGIDEKIHAILKAEDNDPYRD